MTVATLVLAGATLGAWYEGRRFASPTLGKSFEADPADWQDPEDVPTEQDDSRTDCGMTFPVYDNVLRPKR